MKKLQLTILTKEELKERYDYLKNTKIARLTDKAVTEGWSIGILYYSDLKYDSFSNWIKNAENVVSANFKGHRYKIGMFTDLSKVDEDKLYFSFKTKKDIQVTHSITGCDSEGFIYNC